jgi:hypothetical protein
MKLQINDNEYEVDVTPLQERAEESILSLIHTKDEGAAALLKPVIKSACTMALPYLGLKKNDRNDDPIKLIAMHLSSMIFRTLEEKGIVLTGVIVPRETSGGNEHGNSGDGGRPLGDHRGDGQWEDLAQ